MSGLGQIERKNRVCVCVRARARERAIDRRSSADDGHAVGVEDHAGGGLVGAGQVIEVLAVLVLLGLDHLLVLLQADNQTLVGDGLHVVLINVRRLVEGSL